MHDPLHILRATYGYGDFRGQQAEIVGHAIAGGDAFVLMPTGGGKSLCYQIPALCRRGVGIVVSPLIALMQDQIAALHQLGIAAGAIHSGMAYPEVEETKRQLLSGALDLLYVAPERLLMPEFLALLEQCDLALFAIDEAHCMSEWGHDFRPDYAALSILPERFPGVPRIALTATADAPTRADIVRRLKLEGGRQFVGGFDRPNIHYAILPRDNPRQQLWRFISEKHPEDSGIVYCNSRKSADQWAAWLRGKGLNAYPYHAGLESAQRADHQSRFLRESPVVMVATVAFGMGIDKPDIRYVAHVNIPKNIEAYYQETGRAGRDGMPADALMLYGMDDVAMQRQWIDTSDAPVEQKRIQQQKLGALLTLCEAASCRRQYLLRYFGDACGPCGNCDTCNAPPETFDGTVAAQKALSAAYRTGERFGVAYLIALLLGEADERMSRFGHDRLPTFGIGTEHGKQAWQHIFRQLAAADLLTVDIAGHGGLRITDAGRRFLKERGTIQLRLPPAKAEGRARKPRGTAPAAAPQDPLFLALRDLRQEIAREQNVPAYVIFHDRTLAELAAARPETAQDMLQVSGVGEAKLSRYGARFLDTIAAHAA